MLKMKTTVVLRASVTLGRKPFLVVSYFPTTGSSSLEIMQEHGSDLQGSFSKEVDVG